MSFLSGLLKVGGAAGGFALGGPAGAAAGYSLGGAAGDMFGGGDGGGDPMKGAADQYGQYATQSRNRFMDALNGGQDAVNATTKAAVANALPGYMQNLQGSRENAIRRGTSNGDLQTSYEGDLASAFQRNVSNAAGAQAANLYGQKVAGYGSLAANDSNNWLSLLAGNRDANQANKNNWMQLGAGALGAAGQAAGAYYGRQ